MNAFILLFALMSVFHTASAETHYLRGQVLHFLDTPHAADQHYEYFKDGLLIINDGKVDALGSFDQLKPSLSENVPIQHYKNGLILPGFIDTHIHYPQLDMIAANGGGQLMQWLERYTFPFEEKFQDVAYAEDVANFFLDELLRNGATSALVFASSYPHAVSALFSAADKRKMRIITGLTMADRNLPPGLTQQPDQAVDEAKQLIKQWHNQPNSRLLYAITPRFAPTTSPLLFQKIQQLKHDHPDVHVHTHISENKDEVAFAKTLFATDSYLEIYDRYNLLGDKTLLAHGVYLTDAEFDRIHETGTAIAFCPTSELFLGSGLFNLSKAHAKNVRVGLGTDVGAGTSFSALETLNDAYKVAQLQGTTMSPFEGFYLATLGSARALHLENKVGNFVKGKEADVVVLNLEGATPLLKRRLSYADTLGDKLFVLMTLGDERSVLATYVAGELAYDGATDSAIPGVKWRDG